MCGERRTKHWLGSLKGGLEGEYSVKRELRLRRSKLIRTFMCFSVDFESVSD